MKEREKEVARHMKLKGENSGVLAYACLIITSLFLAPLALF